MRNGALCSIICLEECKSHYLGLNACYKYLQFQLNLCYCCDQAKSTWPGEESKGTDGRRARKSARTVGEGEKEAEGGRPVLNGKKSKQRTFL